VTNQTGEKGLVELGIYQIYNW